MAKLEVNPSTCLYPVPVALVTCRREGETPNIITIAWVGTVCSDPPMLSISIRPTRYSHGIVKETGEFVVNIPDEPLLRVTDVCGVVSGRDEDKFALTGLTAEPASKVGAPLIAECPVSIECKTTEVLSLGVHDMFVAEIVAVHVAETVAGDGGRWDFDGAAPICFCKGEYRGLGAKIGSYGYSKGVVE
jgi:flavin reductase (DIM6/NTAB) family NADH-FMN oxidoreductase RutF